MKQNGNPQFKELHYLLIIHIGIMTFYLRSLLGVWGVEEFTDPISILSILLLLPDDMSTNRSASIIGK